MSEDTEDDKPVRPGPRPGFAVPARADEVQCPNCCRFARVTARSAELIHYACDLCGTIGAAPAES